MKEKTRKILKKVGAGLMLGISLIGIGTGWSRANTQAAYKRVRNLRKKDQENLNQEDQVLANIAEEEAKGVFSEQQRQRQEQQQLEGSLSSVMQRFFRFGVVVLWALSAGLFFSSLIFNQPFSLGKGMLSILPGNPHPAILILEPNHKEYALGEQIEINLKVDTKKIKAELLRVFVDYDEEESEFIKSQIKDTDLTGEVREGNGELEFIINIPNAKLGLEDGDVITLFFSPKIIATERKNKIYINQEKSRIFSGGVNILGKTIPAEFSVKTINQSN